MSAHEAQVSVREAHAETWPGIDVVARYRPVLRSSAVAEEIYVGNAATDAAARGWLLGHFMPPGDPRNSDDVEIKWGVHPAGERRPGWVTDDPRSMLSVLVSGRFRIDLPDRSVVLAEQGDYIVFHGVNHTWEAEEASVVISVRWPSLPGFNLADADQKQAR